MNVELSYDKEFSDLLNNLKDKYGAAIFELEGIGSQLDLNKFSKEFFSTKVTADTSIDDNSNVGDSSVISYTIELTKPYEKLNSLYLLWKEMRRLYHTDVSNNLIEMYISGDLYIHDFHSINRFYCYNYSTYDIMNKGLPMVIKIKSLPPKYLYSFKSQLEQFIVIAANSSNGASGVADTLLVMSYYVKNIVNTLKDGHFKFAGEDDVWAYVKETLVSLIYTVNQPFRAGHQSPFVNISVFDKYFIEDLSDMYIFEDGSTLDINIINKLQDIYLDIMNEEMRRTPVTFPVTTACFSIDDNREFKDPDFVKYIIEKNEEFGFINLYSGKSTTLSSCCFSGKQIVQYYKNGEYIVSKFDEVIDDNDITLFVNEEFPRAKSKLVKIKMPNDTHIMYNIVTSSDAILDVTGDHIHYTNDGDKYTYELDVGSLLYDDEVMDFTPITSISKYVSNDKYVYCFEITEPDAPPYFILYNGIITHNCRLRSDMESIGYANSIGGSSTKIGSVGVTTINMYRLAKRSTNIDAFKHNLAEMVGACARINHTRRTIIRKKIDKGFAPMYTYGFLSLDKQFSTCGISAFYEAMCELGIDITSDAGLNIAIEIIDIINAENKKYDKAFGYSHNCEAVPAESASVKIAQKDRLLGYNKEYELYSNQFIPLTASADILERIKIQGALDSHFSGGSILHLNFDQRIDDVDKIYNILHEAVKQGVIYSSIVYVLNECENGHMNVGNIEICSTCGGQLINKYMKIVGYLSNVKNWNKTRRSVDFPNRKFYKGNSL